MNFHVKISSRRTEIVYSVLQQIFFIKKKNKKKNSAHNGQQETGDSLQQGCQTQFLEGHTWSS